MRDFPEISLLSIVNNNNNDYHLDLKDWTQRYESY